MPLNLSSIGCTIDELDTPALCIELDALHRNIGRIADECRQHEIAWRPHMKGHKSPQIAHAQLAAGAIGLTCAKLSEAEVMAGAGVTDLLIANQIVGPAKMRRLSALRQMAAPLVCVDHADQVAQLSEALTLSSPPLQVLVEVDIGLARAGVAPGQPTVGLARTISQTPGLRFGGIMGYEGHLLTLPDLREKEERVGEALDRLARTKQALEKVDLECAIVSAGGTGSYRYTLKSPVVTEIQAGGIIFMDAFYRYSCQVEGYEYALKVLATVVSRPAADRAIIDAGRKAVHGELHVPLVAGHETIRVDRLSAEHGSLQLEDSSRDLRIGDRLELIPGYSDLTCMLYDQYHVVQEGRVVAVWPVAARGKLH